MIVQNYNSPVAKTREEFIRKVIEMSKPIDELIKIINSFPADDNQLSIEDKEEKRIHKKNLSYLIKERQKFVFDSESHISADESFKESAKKFFEYDK